MTMRAPYSRSPLTEAVIDIQIAPDVALNILASIPRTELERYPQQETIHQLTAEIPTRATDLPPTTISVALGHRLTSADDKYLVQARINGLTLSRFAPYESWEPFRNEARRIWDIYLSTAKPQVVTRIAVRYINQLNIPLGSKIESYLQFYPEIPASLPQLVGEYVMRAQLPQLDIEGMLILTEAVVPPSDPASASLVLDIDLFKEGTIPAEDGAQLWSEFEVLRDRKDVIFEACITEETRRMIQ